MRTILFRGKCIDWSRPEYCKWVYGSLFIARNGKCQILTGYTEYKDHVWTVNPDTVGQYTCLEDKNDTEIFEGDIIKVGNRNDCRYVVEWDKSSFYLRNYLGGKAPLDLYPCPELEVLGSIHDNPEFLKYYWDSDSEILRCVEEEE